MSSTFIRSVKPCLGLAVLLCCLAQVLTDGNMARTRAQDYFMQYRYMGPDNPSPRIANLMETDPEMAYTTAVRMFQMHWNLNVTGEIDIPTAELMTTPRCGIPDMMTMEDIPPDMMADTNSRQKRYTLFGGKWPSNSVSYKFLNYPLDGDLSPAQIKYETARAFKVWEAVSPLRFTEATGSTRANINIRFARYAHGDGGSFDGRGGTLAHAYSPTNGDTHFDDDETWTIDTYSGTNYFQVAAHEFGHALGLGHSNINEALMAPFYRGYQPNFRLHSDDILGIQSRYGARTDGGSATTTTTTTPRPPRPVPTRPPVKPPVKPPQVPNNPSICEDMTFDAITIALEDGQEVVYGFRGNEYFKIDSRGFGIVQGYPRLISNDWERLSSNIDAALYLDPLQEHKWEWNSDRWEWVWVSRVIRPAQNYFFKGSLVWQYIDGRLSSGFPRAISSEFPGLPRSGNIDAAFVWTGNGQTYFIIGNLYYRFNMQLNRVESGYPQPLSNWVGLPQRIDASLRHTNKWTYLFSGNQYYRLSNSRMEIASDYPRSNNPYWLRCERFQNRPGRVEQFAELLSFSSEP